MIMLSFINSYKTYNIVTKIYSFILPSPLFLKDDPPARGHPLRMR